MKNEMQDSRPSLTALIAGGFFIVLPVLLLVLVIAKLYQALAERLAPLLNAMPGTVFHNPSVRFVVVLLAIALLFLLIGALARTRMGRMTGRWMELALLSRLPFYNALRTLTSGLAGRDDTASLKPVLVTVDVPGLCQLGFIVERHANGSATVFLPSSPNPGSGTVVIVEPARIRELHAPLPRLLQCLGRWGHGTAAMLEKFDGQAIAENVDSKK